MNYRGVPRPAWEEHFGASRTIKDSVLHFEREFNRNSAVGQKRTYGELYASGDFGKRLPFLNDMSGSDPFHNTRELSHIKRASGHTGRWPVIFNDDIQSGYTPNQAECSVYTSDLYPNSRGGVLSKISGGHPLPGWPVFMVRERVPDKATFGGTGANLYRLLDIIDMNSALRDNSALAVEADITYIGIRDNTSQRPGASLPSKQKILIKYAGYADIPHMFKPKDGNLHVRYAWFIPKCDLDGTNLQIEGHSTTGAVLDRTVTRHAAFAPTYAGQFCDVSGEENKTHNDKNNAERPGMRCGYHLALFQRGKIGSHFSDGSYEIKMVTRGINLAG
jgi:hypothetical protein